MDGVLCQGSFQETLASPCSDAELSANRLSLLCVAAASDALGAPPPIELDVLLLWRKKKHTVKPSDIVFYMIHPQDRGFKRFNEFQKLSQ